MKKSSQQKIKSKSLNKQNKHKIPIPDFIDVPKINNINNNNHNNIDLNKIKKFDNHKLK